MNGRPATTVPIRLVVHFLPQTFDVERVLTHEDRREPVPPRGRPGSVEARFADVRLTGDFADAGDALVGVNFHDEDIERPVGESFDVGDAEVDRFDRGDFHGELGSG